MWRDVLAEPTPAPAELAAAVRTRDLCLWYGDFQALYDVSIDFKQGQITGLI